ncbi:DNA-binding protein [Methanolobus vulcani]|jgi:programmed cell death protein 5|uniref:DNA-binding protein FKV42_03555 n=1 Tax=Methanolobus vulcani TaxID=38026 RepID=A0A7Z8P2Y8_9EURY|nr:DNA-binding protein [Methanolobus vulcani]TQD27313.1 DNA-binding protein [Methanolobus vulcani]
MTDDLEEIRRKRLAQLQQQQAAQQQMGGADMQAAMQQEQMQAEMEAKKQALMRQILTPEARERLTNLRMSRKELVEQLENQLIMLAQSGRLQTMIDDEKLKQLLVQMQPKKRETTIKRM